MSALVSADYGLKSDIAPCPKSAMNEPASQERAARGGGGADGVTS